MVDQDKQAKNDTKTSELSYLALTLNYMLTFGYYLLRPLYMIAASFIVVGFSGQFVPMLSAVFFDTYLNSGQGGEIIVGLVSFWLLPTIVATVFGSIALYYLFKWSYNLLSCWVTNKLASIKLERGQLVVKSSKK